MTVAGLAGVDTALWDLRGRAANLNVSHLIGAAATAVPTYASGGLWLSSSIDELQVEAHVRPEDADSIYAGMTARVNLSAYQQRRLPMIKGLVTNISADRITDPRTGQAYFNVQLTVDRTPLKDYPDAHIIPGMPVEVAIETGTRTAHAPVPALHIRGRAPLTPGGPAR